MFYLRQQCENDTEGFESLAWVKKIKNKAVWNEMFCKNKCNLFLDIWVIPWLIAEIYKLHQELVIVVQMVEKEAQGGTGVKFKD